MGIANNCLLKNIKFDEISMKPANNIRKNDELNNNDSEHKASKILRIFKEQLSENKLTLKLLEIGEYDSNKLSTYIELIKIFINF